MAVSLKNLFLSYYFLTWFRRNVFVYRTGNCPSGLIKYSGYGVSLPLMRPAWIHYSLHWSSQKIVTMDCKDTVCCDEGAEIVSIPWPVHAIIFKSEFATPPPLPRNTFSNHFQTSNHTTFKNKLCLFHHTNSTYIEIF